MLGFFFIVNKLLHLIMQKIKLSRDHNDFKKGDTIEITKEQLEYFKSVGLIAEQVVVKEVKSKK
jgi:hypothetical protein